MDIDDDDDDESRFVPLEELRRITGLNSVFPDEVFQIFESHQDCEEGLHIDSFSDSLKTIMQLRVSMLPIMRSHPFQGSI